MAVDFTMAIWVETVATVGVGAVEFTGVVGVGVLGLGWAIALTLYLLLVRMVLLLSLNLGFGAFLVMGLLFWGGPLVLGCSWVGCSWDWGWGLGLEPSLPSNSRYILIFWMKKG